MRISGEYIHLKSDIIPKNTIYDTVCDVSGFDIEKTTVSINGNRYMASDFKTIIEDKSYPSEFRSKTIIQTQHNTITLNEINTEDVIFNTRCVSTGDKVIYVFISILLNDKEIGFNVTNNLKKSTKLILNNK